MKAERLLAQIRPRNIVLVARLAGRLPYESIETS